MDSAHDVESAMCRSVSASIIATVRVPLRSIVTSMILYYYDSQLDINFPNRREKVTRQLAESLFLISMLD